MNKRFRFDTSLEKEFTEEVKELVHLTKRVKRWPFALTVLIVGGISSTLSESLTPGPNWVLLVIVMALLIPLYIAVLLGHHRWTRVLSFAITFAITVGVMISVVSLVYSLFHHSAGALPLFRNAILLWSANVLVFSTWYWEVDQGGPIRRRTSTPGRRDFMFPQQMSLADDWQDWRPSFTDYLFLSFNTSTAFSPTDTVVMSKRAKVLMMTQSSISLTVVAVLAARAINIIP